MDIDRFIANDVIPDIVFRGSEGFTLDDGVDKMLSLNIEGLAESRRELVIAAEASGIAVRDRDG